MVVIGKRGKIKGELKADKLVVNGTFEGSADCVKVDVLTDGVFNGDVVSEELTIEAKAKFQGQSRIRNVANSKTKANTQTKVPLTSAKSKSLEFSKEL